MQLVKFLSYCRHSTFALPRKLAYPSNLSIPQISRHLTIVVNKHNPRPVSLKNQQSCGIQVNTLVKYYCSSESENNNSSQRSSNMAENKFGVDYDKLGRAGCKKCKQKLTKGELRVAKITPNFFHDGEGTMKQYHHPKCLFETFIKARSTTKIVEGPDDLEGFADIKDEDKDFLRNLIEETLAKKGSPKTPKKKAPPKKSPAAAAAASTSVAKPSPAKASTSPIKAIKSESPAATASASVAAPPLVKDDDPIPDSRDFSEPADKDNAFRNFRRICADLANVSSYLEKTKIIQSVIQKGCSGAGFHGDLYLLLKLLLPGEKGNKQVYNLNNKQLVKIFSQIFGASQDAMVTDLEQGDVAETVRIFFEKSSACPPHRKSILTNQEVDGLLRELSQYTKEDDQQRVLTKIARRSTANDLKMVVRLIKHDLRINAGAKHILEGLNENAYEAYQASRDLKDVVERVLDLQKSAKQGGPKKMLSIKASLMTPVLPMLAEACKSVEFAFKRCPNGMYAEIKYDGERVQVHKRGGEFAYFSRSLKPVLPHKVAHFKDWIPPAFPGGADLILDAEVLLIDTKTSKPLPFGTLGVHKKAQFSDANVALFVFDVLHYNGETMMHKPIRERRKILSEVMKEVPDRILFSEMTHITKPDVLRDLMMKTFREGLEGLVLKDLESVYEPGKRHWLKVKKDYLAEGAMADSADLVLLGAYYGTGNKGGLLSVFLMGCHDVDRDRWVTVTKCHCGFDDKTLERLQKPLEESMVKIAGDKTRVPAWLHMNRASNITPDFVVKDPKKSPVWEITGAEFSKSESHTADGISIRFPRMTKMRDDKDWTNHTDLNRLRLLYKKSKETSDMPDLMGGRPAGKSPAGKWAKSPGAGAKAEPGGSSAASSLDDEEEQDESMEVDRSQGSSSSSKRRSTEKIGGDDDDATPPPAKKVKKEKPSPVKKSPCKYGAKCYQTNSEHRTQFSHDATAAATNGGSHDVAGSNKGPLPDVFRGMSFYVPESAENVKLLKRYIIAFDGDVVKEFDKALASHIIVLNAGDTGASDKCVPIDWVWRCIKHKKIVPLK